MAANYEITLLTWNLQGFKEGSLGPWLRALLKEHNVDVACLQECTTLGGWGGGAKFGDYHLGFQEWAGPKNGNSRCSLGMLWHPDVAVVNGPTYTPSQVDTCRGILHGEFSKHRIHFGVCDYHGFGDGRIAENVRWVKTQYYDRRWLMLGDFNVEGDDAVKRVPELDESLTALVSGSVTRPASGKELDWGITNIESPAYKATALDNDGQSDHLPVLITIAL